MRIAPSIMCSKPWDVKTYIEKFEQCDISLVHYDVMDGNYVPNISIGSLMYKSIHEISDIPLDLHLMVVNPDVAIDYFDIRPGDYVSFHPDTLKNPALLLNKIRSKGAKAGIAISPKVSLDYVVDLANDIDFTLIMGVEPGFSGQRMFPETVQKLKDTKQIALEHNENLEIHVDGDCKPENALKAYKAGAEVCVVGSALINNDLDPAKFEQTLNDYMHEFNELKNA